MRRVAIFDIDGTIFRSSLLIETTNALIAAGIFPTQARRLYQQSYERWLNRKGEYGDYISDVVRAFDTYIAGVPRAKFLRLVRGVMSYHKHRVYRYTRDLVQTLHTRGYFLVAISHSPTDVVEAFAKRWGFQRVYGLGFELNRNGVFTGRVAFNKHVHTKANMLLQAVAENHLSLRGSIAVGDAEADIPMLKMVDRPICFNPNGKLLRHARRHGWEVVVERKDVIYHL